VRPGLGGELRPGSVRVPGLQLEPGELCHEVKFGWPDIAMRAAEELGPPVVAETEMMRDDLLVQHVIDRGTDCLVGEIVLNDLRAEDETCSVRMPIGAAPRLDDTRIDSILMSILRPEWEAKQGAPRADGSP
jgi:hypothetical protein